MITFSEYSGRLTSTTFQFDLSKKAIRWIMESEDTISSFAEDEAKRVCGIIAAVSEELAISIEDKISFKEAQINKIPANIEAALNRIYQNEFILKVALLEGFICDAHREILRQKPSLLKHDRKINLGKLVAIGYDTTITEEIERQVHSLDREPLEKRAKYWSDVLGISWELKPKVLSVQMVKDVLHIRNCILHEDPDFIMSDTHSNLAHLVSFALPYSIVEQAVALYPAGFKLMRNKEE